MPNHYVGDLLRTIAISGRSRVRTELFKLFAIPASTPHPVKIHRQLACHGYLRDLSSAAHGELEEPGKTGDRRNVPQFFERIEIGKRPVCPKFFRPKFFPSFFTSHLITPIDMDSLRDYPSAPAARQKILPQGEHHRQRRSVPWLNVGS